MTEHVRPSDYLDAAAEGEDWSARGPLIHLIDEVDNAIRGPAVRAAIDARVEAIVKFGHDRDSDAAGAARGIPEKASNELLHARDFLIPGERFNPEAAKKRLKKAAGMVLAALDRVDREIANQQKQQQERGL